MEAVDESEDTMFCVKCGTKLEEGMAFCPSCGNRVFGGDAAETVQFDAQETRPLSQAETQAFDQPTQKMTDVPGYPAGMGSAPVPPPPAQTAYQSASYQGQYRAQTQPQGQGQGQGFKPGVSPAILAIVAIAAVVVIGALLFLLLRPGQSQTQSSDTAAQATASAAASTAAASDAAASNAAASNVASGTAASNAASAAASAASQSAADAEKAAAEKLASSQTAAVKAMSNAGMQIFTGTIRVTTYAQRGSEVGLADFARETKELVMLEFDTTQNIGGRLSGDMGKEGVRSGDSISFKDTSTARAYDGKHVTVAAYSSDLWFPSDVAGALYTVAGDAYIVYADGEAPILTSAPAPTTPVVEAEKPKPAPTPSSGSYMLPDSSSRQYSYGELSNLSNYELYIARNEIYARHGRMFNRQDLRDYFNSQSWYSGTIAPEYFSDDMLNSTEAANVKTMLEIEQARGSSYL